MQSSQVIAIDEETFSEVLESEVPFLLDFTAEHCAPCRALEPILAKIAKERAGEVRVGRVDVSAAPRIAQRFQIRGTPTVIAFRGGREVGRRLGLSPERALLALFEP